MFPSDLDEDYVRKHARPGEDWGQARSRLEGVVASRYRKLPVCAVCAAGAGSLEIAVQRHSLGMCAASLSEWPAAALSQRMFDAAHEQSAKHTSALEAIARANIQSRLHHIQAQTHPINAIRAACGAGGYIDCLGMKSLAGGVSRFTWSMRRRKQLLSGSFTSVTLMPCRGAQPGWLRTVAEAGG